MNLGQNGALSLFLLISLIHSSAALASQNRGGNDIQREQAPAEHSENAEIPEWLQVAQLISNRLSVSEDLIEDLGITAKNNSLVLNQILNLLQKMEREKPVVCPKVEEKLVVQSEADTSSAGGEQSPKTEIVLETQPRQTSSGDVSEQTDSSEDDGDSQSPVKSRIQRIREKIRAILMNLKENKNPNVLASQIDPDCKDTFLIVGCRDFAYARQNCQTDTHWKLCCRSCAYGYIQRAINSKP